MGYHQKNTFYRELHLSTRIASVVQRETLLSKLYISPRRSITLQSGWTITYILKMPNLCGKPCKAPQLAKAWTQEKEKLKRETTRLTSHCQWLENEEESMVLTERKKGRTTFYFFAKGGHEGACNTDGFDVNSTLRQSGPCSLNSNSSTNNFWEKRFSQS